MRHTLSQPVVPDKRSLTTDHLGDPSLTGWKNANIGSRDIVDVHHSIRTPQTHTLKVEIEDIEANHFAGLAGSEEREDLGHVRCTDTDAVPIG